MLEDAKPSTTLKGLKNRRNEPILAVGYIDFKFNSVPRDHEKFAFARPLCWCMCTFCVIESGYYLYKRSQLKVSENNFINHCV